MTRDRENRPGINELFPGTSKDWMKKDEGLEQAPATPHNETDHDVENMSQASREDTSPRTGQTPTIPETGIAGAEDESKGSDTVEEDRLGIFSGLTGEDIVMENDGQTWFVNGYPHKQTKGGQWRRTDRYGNFTKSDSKRPEHILPDMWKDMTQDEKDAEILHVVDKDEPNRPGTSITPIAAPKNSTTFTTKQGGEKDIAIARFNNEPPTDEENTASPANDEPCAVKQGEERIPIWLNATMNHPQTVDQWRAEPQKTRREFWMH